MSLQPGDTIKKDPDSVEEPYVMNWTAYLARLTTVLGTTQTITASEWFVEGDDAELTIDDDAIVTGNLKTQMKYSGGTLHRVYTLTNRITTTSGHVQDRSVRIRIGHQ